MIEGLDKLLIVVHEMIRGAGLRATLVTVLVTVFFLGAACFAIKGGSRLVDACAQLDVMSA